MLGNSDGPESRAYVPDRNANRDLLIKFYEIHDKAKIQNVDRILHCYAARIAVLKFHLERKYNATPALFSDAVLAAREQLSQGHITANEYEAIVASDHRIQEHQRMDCVEEERKVMLRKSEKPSKHRPKLWFNDTPAAEAQEQKDRKAFLSKLKSRRIRPPTTEAEFHAARFYSDTLNR